LPKRNKSYSKAIEIDLNLNIVRYIQLPQQLNFYAFYNDLDTSSFLISGLGSRLYQPGNVCDALYLYKLDSNHDTIRGTYLHPSYPEDTLLYPFFWNNIAINNDNIALSGTYNIDIFNYPTQSTPCWVQLTLFDYDLNMEKQLYYGDGVKAYYGMDIIATSDGGFAMCGLVNDPQNTTNPQPDMFVLKVNSEGLMTGNSEREQPEVTEVILWPNPGNNVIHLKSASQLTNASFELYNPSGILCLTQKLSAGTHQTINTEHLTAGIYPYRIINGNRVVKTGKWIKK
jgi:hypothetical protein